MGVKFGYLIKENNQIPSVYIYSPEGYSNLVISKECVHMYVQSNHNFGYMIYEDHNNLIFKDENNNTLSDGDVDNIIVIIDILCRNIGNTKELKYISIEDIENIKKEKYNLLELIKARNNINDIGEYYEKKIW